MYLLRMKKKTSTGIFHPREPNILPYPAYPSLGPVIHTFITGGRVKGRAFTGTNRSNEYPVFLSSGAIHGRDEGHLPGNQRVV